MAGRCRPRSRGMLPTAHGAGQSGFERVAGASGALLSAIDLPGGTPCRPHPDSLAPLNSMLCRQCVFQWRSKPVEARDGSRDALVVGNPQERARADVGAIGQIGMPGDDPAEGKDKAAFGQIPKVELGRSEEHTSELQSLMRNSYAVFCLKKK